MKVEHLEVLIDEAKGGNTNSRESIISSMRPLIIYFIKQWRVTHYRPDIAQDFDDDIVTGQICVDWAINVYRKDAGSKFSSFLYHCLKLEFSNQMRHDMAEKRRINRLTANPPKKGYDGEDTEVINDIPYFVDTDEKLIVQEFIDSLDDDDSEIVRKAILNIGSNGDNDNNIEGLIFTNSIRRKFLDFFPDYRRAIYQRIFSQRLQTAIEIYKARIKIDE